MTTKFLDNKICTFRILLSWRFPTKKKQRFWTILPSAPKPPPPLKKRKLYFCCCLTVSEKEPFSLENFILGLKCSFPLENLNPKLVFLCGYRL